VFGVSGVVVKKMTDVIALWASKAQSRGTLGVFGVVCE
jgi:hypothetical protein